MHYVFIGQPSLHYVFIGQPGVHYVLRRDRADLLLSELVSSVKTWMASNQTEVYILTFSKEDTSSHPLTTKDNESFGFAEKLNVFKKTSSLLVGLRIHAHFYPIM